MTRDEATEIRYALRDYIEALIMARGYAGMQFKADQKAEELELALMNVRSTREGDQTF